MGFPGEDGGVEKEILAEIRGQGDFGEAVCEAINIDICVFSDEASSQCPLPHSTLARQ